MIGRTKHQLRQLVVILSLGLGVFHWLPHEQGHAGAQASGDAKTPDKWAHLNLGEAKVVDDFIRIKPQSTIKTKETFAGPIEIVVVARTEKHNIRLNAFNGACVIFNWEVKRDELRVNRPDGNDKRESGSLATAKVLPLDANTWYTLRWRITEEGMEVAVNGKVVFSEKRTNNLSAKRPVVIASGGFVIDVKSFDVSVLAKAAPVQDKKDVAQRPKEEPETKKAPIDLTVTERVNLNAHANGVSCLAISNDGKLVVTGGGDKTLALWAVDSWEKVKTFKGQTTRVESVAFSPNSKFIASVGYLGEGSLCYWDIAKTKLVSHLTWPDSGAGGVAVVRFAPDGKTLFVGCNEPPGVNFVYQGYIRRFTTKTREEIRPSFGRDINVGSLAISPDGKTLAVGGSGDVELYDLKTHAKAGSLDGGLSYTGRVVGLAFSVDGKRIGMLGQARNSGYVVIWDIEKRQVVQRLSVANGVRSLEVLPATDVLVIGCGKELICWDSSNNAILHTAKFSSEVNCVGICPVNTIVVGLSDGTMKVLTYATKTKK